MGSGGVDHTHNMDHNHYNSGNTGDMSAHSSGHFGGSGYSGSSLFTDADNSTFTLSDGGHYQFDDGGGGGRASTVNMNISHTHSWGGWCTPPYVRNDAHDTYKLDTNGASKYLHSHSINSDGGNEARPTNYTIRIWKRIS